MDCSLPGSSVHGIFQARILKWVPFPSPGGEELAQTHVHLPNPRIKSVSPALEGRFFTTERPGKPHY